ncbi:hypothetical protein AOLI_G00322060 [Acnodon oligacanthus]
MVADVSKNGPWGNLSEPSHYQSHSIRGLIQGNSEGKGGGERERERERLFDLGETALRALIPRVLSSPTKIRPVKDEGAPEARLHLLLDVGEEARSTVAAIAVQSCDRVARRHPQLPRRDLIPVTSR